ncbi:MAG: dTDP-4-dehydrorhamnose reductase [Bacteroidales bacterium]|nr:dTDP-4-dehydrorhamnose reductase [Bacteroidales bacterium]
MNKILVTGANGQLGNEIRKISFSRKNFNFYFTDVDELDITKLENIQSFCSENKFDYIINCAAYTNVDKAESDKVNAEKINAEAVKNLSEISQKYKIPLIHISTDYVFDGKSNIPYKENDKTNPRSVYGKTKLQGEEFAKKAYKGIIIRTAWLYSSFGNNFVKTMLRLGKERNEINVVSDQKGSPTYAEDLARAILEIVKQTTENQEHNFSGIYHYSDEGSCTWYEFAKEIMQKANLKCKVNPVSSDEYSAPVKRPEYSLLDKTKIKETFNVKIPFWKDSLKKCLILLSENE